LDWHRNSGNKRIPDDGDVVIQFRFLKLRDVRVGSVLGVFMKSPTNSVFPFPFSEVYFWVPRLAGYLGYRFRKGVDEVEQFSLLHWSAEAE